MVWHCSVPLADWLDTLVTLHSTSTSRSALLELPNRGRHGQHGSHRACCLKVLSQPSERHCCRPDAMLQDRGWLQAVPGLAIGALRINHMLQCSYMVTAASQA